MLTANQSFCTVDNIMLCPCTMSNITKHHQIICIAFVSIQMHSSAMYMYTTNPQNVFSIDLVIGLHMDNFFHIFVFLNISL